MPDFRLELSGIEFAGEFKDNATARLFYDQLPVSGEINLVDGNIYFSEPILQVKEDGESVELKDGLVGYDCSTHEIVILHNVQKFPKTQQVNWFAVLLGDMNLLNEVKDGEIAFIA